MHWSKWATMFVLCFASPQLVGQMGEEEEPQELAKTVLGRTYFRTPEGAVVVPVPNGDFEQGGKGEPAAWSGAGLQRVSEGAPHGLHVAHSPGGRGTLASVPGLPLISNAPHFLSLWLKSSEPVSGLVLLTKADTTYGRHINISLPATGGRWQRVGHYLRNLPGGEDGRLVLRGPNAGQAQPFSMDDVRLRTATEEEFSRAWQGWRATYPARDLSPRPGDGAHLALTVQKLENGFDPPRPFKVWAIGSSYTNMLGDGEVLRQHLRQRFPNCPPIIYKKHVGSSVPWQYVRGWANHIVIPDQPDLIIIYTIGNPAHLDAMLADIRAGCTADVIVPSIHWRMRGAGNWGKSEDAPDQKVSAVRAVCAKHGVEFVENRREWAEYMSAHGMKLEINPRELLKDAVHQSDYGALVINENIVRHITPMDHPAYAPETRERRVAPTVVDGWRKQGQALVPATDGATLRIAFTGNRIDLIGHRSPDGGTARIRIDGAPADEIPAFYASYIACGPRNLRPKRGMVADRSPHAVTLKENIIPQTWTIRMIDDKGNYEIAGSVTGKDGIGNVEKPFTSVSGQIAVPPELWRRAYDPRTKVFNNAAGDTFTFSVYRTTMGALSFKGEGGGIRAILAANLANANHILQVVTNGDGQVAIQAFDVFEPPLKR